MKEIHRRHILKIQSQTLLENLFTLQKILASKRVFERQSLGEKFFMKRALSHLS